MTDPEKFYFSVTTLYLVLSHSSNWWGGEIYIYIYFFHISIPGDKLSRLEYRNNIQYLHWYTFFKNNINHTEKLSKKSLGREVTQQTQFDSGFVFNPALQFPNCVLRAPWCCGDSYGHCSMDNILEENIVTFVKYHMSYYYHDFSWT